MILATTADGFWQICGGMAGLVTVASFAYRWAVVPAQKALRQRRLDAEKEAREHTVQIVDERLDVKLEPIIAEVTTNGGGSLKDSVLRLATEFGDFKTETQARWVVLDEVAAKVDLAAKEQGRKS